MGLGPQRHRDGFFAVAGDLDLVDHVGFFECADGERFVVGVVFDEQDELGGIGDGHGNHPSVNQKVAPEPMVASAQMLP